MKIKELGEFGLIGSIAERFRDLVPVRWEGIGDDCAVIPYNNDSDALVVTTDLLVEDIHFLRERIAPYELGYKALAVNLSDIAAMGARPLATFLSLGLPPDTDTEWCDAFFEGYCSFGVPLLGGDTTSSRAGIVVNVTVLGTATEFQVKRRSGAQPGDFIAVTGPLGGSAAGLRVLLDGLAVEDDTKELVQMHHMPYPYVEQGQWLGNHAAVHAMMDVSDGLASDLQHMLTASDVSAVVELAKLPVPEGLREAAAEYGWDPVRLAVEGGEDYVLLLTLARHNAARICRDYEDYFHEPLHIIGRIVKKADEDEPPRIAWTGLDGGPLPAGEDYQGFNHF